MTTSTLDTHRVRFIAIALTKLERDLERTVGSDREAVALVHDWLYNVQHTLLMMGRHVLH
jgi:hypothetical protein